MAYEEREYRKTFKAEGLVGFEVVEEETDLFIFADKNLQDIAQNIVRKYRMQLQNYIISHEAFKESFSPVGISFFAPKIIKDMSWAAKRAKVGPMAAVAGAIAEKVGRELLKFSKEVIVENGGDIFIKSQKTRKIGIYAGDSPLSGKIAIEIDPKNTPCGICTSSGTVGHSFSYGKADAVVVVAKSAALADAAATAIGNVVRDVESIKEGLDSAKRIRGLSGVLIVKDNQMGIEGKVTIGSI